MDKDRMECAPGKCEFYDEEEDRCLAFECWGLGFLDGCPPLPCEEQDPDEDD